MQCKTLLLMIYCYIKSVENENDLEWRFTYYDKKSLHDRYWGW